MGWGTEHLPWLDDEQLEVLSQNLIQHGQRVQVVHRTPCSNYTQMIHPASGCECFLFLRSAIRLTQLRIQ